MTTEHLEAVIFWLEKRKVTFDYLERISNFVRQPATRDKVQTAQDTFNLLLREAKTEHKLSIAQGGYTPDSLPQIIS